MIYWVWTYFSHDAQLLGGNIWILKVRVGLSKALSVDQKIASYDVMRGMIARARRFMGDECCLEEILVAI